MLESTKSCRIIIDDVGGFDFIEEKGWFAGAAIETDIRRYDFVFYDLDRLKQEVDGQLQSASFYFEANLLIVKAVRKEVIVRSLNELVVSGDFAKFISTPIESS